jgi:hypothetical protein
MFGYVQGIRKALPSMKVTEAIRTFLDAFQIEEDVYCFDTAKTTYYRMLGNIVESVQRGMKIDGEEVIL